MKSIIAPLAGALCMAVASMATAQDVSHLRMDTMPPGTSPGQFGIAFSQVVQKSLPIEIQISSGKAAPKMAVDAAAGKVDLFLSAASINQFMMNKEAMFAKVDNAPELFSELRGILNYPMGPYQFVTFADSGIESMQDFAGHKIFLGPPAGGATVVAQSIVEGATGLTAGEDFEVMRFDWNSAETAFLDRQMDVYVAPTNIGSPTIAQFALANDIRIIGMPDDAWDKPELEATLSAPGRTQFTIPTGAYDGMVNTAPVRTLGTWVGLASTRHVDTDIVYEMTKAFWENIDEVHETAAWMKDITPETALTEMNTPLHAGAYKYYVEAGWDVPDSLRPPEAE